MATTKVNTEFIAVNAISGTIIADNAITATHIATNSISGTLVQDGGIVTTMIAANNITSTKIVTDAVLTRHIADDQVTQAKMANNSVGADELASSAVVTASIVDANITTAKIADDAVTSAKLDTNIDIAGTFDVTGATTLDSTLGIGVASPEGVFEIEDGGTSKDILQKITLDNDDVYGLVVGNDSYSTTLADGLAVTVSNAGVVGLQARGTSSELAFRTVGAERARIDASGNIQIVGGNQMTQGLFFYNGANGHLLSGLRNKSNSSYNDSGGLEFLTSGTSNAAESVKMHLDTQGNLAIGAEPTAPTGGVKGKLHIDGGSTGSRFDALAVKHINTAATGDGPSIRFEGEYNGSVWALAEMSTTNGGAGYGGNFAIELHPGDGTQGSNVSSAFNLKRTVSNQLHMHVHAGGAATYADEASTTTSVANTSCLISIQSQRRAGSNSIAYDAALFFCHYGIDSGATVVELADPGGTFAGTDSDGFVCVYKANNSANVTIKNRLGYSTGLSVQFIRFLGN